jgi:MoaA/NifB/PqqE/SkfB family radical SAM enzyme
MHAEIEVLSFPIFIKWYVTGKCNIRCQHCYLTDYTYTAPLEKLLSFAHYFSKKGVIQIYLLGGEPLIRSDLELLVESITQGGMFVRIATNGLLIPPKRARTLQVAGAHDFQVSLEGSSPETNDPVRGRGTFIQAVQGIQALVNVDAYVTLALTIGHHNVDEIIPFVRLAHTLGARAVKLALFVPFGTGAQAQHMRLLPADIVKARHFIEESRTLFPSVEIDSDLNVPVSVKTPCHKTYGCGAGTTTLVLNPNLSIAACDLLMEEDRMGLPLETPEEIDSLWQKGRLFHKWRGLDPSACTRSIPSFEGVHSSGCHVANTFYGTEHGIYKF